MTKQTEYITVDLVVRTNHETDHLIAFLENRDHIVDKHKWDDRYAWLLNVSCPRPFENPELCIQNYCSEISALPAEAKKQWGNAQFKEFFIGYYVGLVPIFAID
jgi:hypothetical protein